MDRRTFLKLGLSAAGTAALGLSGFAMPFARHIDRRNRRFHEPHIALCPLCPTKCGLVAFTYLGALVQIEGNPKHPANHGRICGRAVALRSLLQHPDRITRPLKRKGKRGAGEWEIVSWERAVREIRESLATSNRIVFDSTSDRTPAAATKVLSSLGAELHMDNPERTLEAVSRRIFGTPYPVYDIGRCDRIILLGEPLSDRPVPFGLELAKAKTEHNAKVIAINPFCGKDAGRADWWIPTRIRDIPTLLAAVIVELFRRGARSATIDTLGLLETETSVEMLKAHNIDHETVKRLAELLHRQNIGFLFGPEILGSAHADSILELSWMFSWFIDPTLPTLNFASVPEIRKHGGLSDRELLELYDEPQDAALIWHRANPVYRHNVPAESLTQASLIIAIAPFVNESGVLADYVLPESMPLEDFHIDTSKTADLMPHIYYAAPAIAPAGEVKTLGEILWLLAPEGTRLQTPPTAEAQARWELESIGIGTSELSELEKDGFITIGSKPMSPPSVNFDFNAIARALSVAPDAGKLELTTTTSPVLGRDELSYQSKWSCEAAHRPLAWINPMLAERMWIADGETVEITNEDGSFEATAWVSEAVHPQAIALYSNVGRPASRFATAKPQRTSDPDSRLVWWYKRAKPLEPNRVLPPAFDDLGNLVTEGIGVELKKK